MDYRSGLELAILGEYSMSGKLDLTIEQGCTFSRLITITDSTNTAVDISADTFRGEVRSSYKSGTIEGSFSFQFHTDGTDGKVVIMMTEVTTTTMTYGKNYVYDIEWVKSNDTVVRLLEGTAVVTPEVTRI